MRRIEQLARSLVPATIILAFQLSGQTLAQTTAIEETRSQMEAAYTKLVSDAVFASIDGDLALEIELTEQALGIAYVLYPADDIRLAEALYTALIAYIGNGDLAQLQKLAPQINLVAKLAYGVDHPDYAYWLAETALLLDNPRTSYQAWPLFQQASDILFSYEDELQSRHISTVGKTASFLGGIGESEESERLFLIGMDIAARYPEARDNQYTNLLNNYGMFLRGHDRLDEAIAVLEEGLAVAEEVLGVGNPNIIPLRVNLEALRKRR